MKGCNDMRTNVLGIAIGGSPYNFVHHVQAHTSSSSLPSCMNCLADHITSGSQPSPFHPLPSLFLRFFIVDPYLAYCSMYDCLESHVSQFFVKPLASVALPLIPLHNSSMTTMFSHLTYTSGLPLRTYSAIILLRTAGSDPLHFHYLP